MLYEICVIISDLFGIPFKTIAMNTSASLLGEPFYLQPEELLYLYIFLENKYNLEFNENHVLNYKFDSIYKICNIIETM